MKISILGFVLCAIAGGIGAHAGGIVGLAAVLIGEIGMLLPPEE